MSDLNDVHLSTVFLLEVSQKVADNRPAGWPVKFRHGTCSLGRGQPVASSRRRTFIGDVDIVCRCRGLRVSYGSRRVPRQTLRSVANQTHVDQSSLRQHRPRGGLPASHRCLDHRVQSVRSSGDSPPIVRLYT